MQSSSQEKNSQELEKLLRDAFPDMPTAAPDPQLELQFPDKKKPKREESK